MIELRKANERGHAAGDAVKISGEPAVVIERGEDAEVLLFDLA